MNLIKHSDLKRGRNFKRGEPLGIVNDDGSILVLDDSQDNICVYDPNGDRIGLTRAPVLPLLLRFNKDFFVTPLVKSPFVVITYQHILFLVTVMYEDN
jgi:hypothetical protein